jgi:hydroxyacylglutathione hydrolase
MEIEVLFTPGHSPGHVTYSVPAEHAVFSGDVLFEGSIGRTDLPGGDHATLMRTLAALVESLPEETVVHAGHMRTTTIGRERATNPFLAQLA